jgi:periplasmic copper chaperone A
MKPPLLALLLAAPGLATAGLATPGLAHEFQAGLLEIAHPYAVETPPTAMTGAGYFSVTNHGTEPDRLLGVRADYPRVELHTSRTNADGVTRMVPLEAIEIAPGATVTLAPRGMHVMFMGLRGHPFEAGGHVPATLLFERAGEVPIEFWVEKRGDAAPQMDHSGHDM